MNLFKAAFMHYPGPAFLGRLFQTRLYHLHPCRRGFFGGWFPTPPYHGSAELAERPASMQASLHLPAAGRLE